MLVLKRRKDERIVVKVGDEEIEICVVGLDRTTARIGIEASREVLILRKELIGRKSGNKEEK